MADIEFEVVGGARKKLRDMGDGTHAEVVATESGAESAGLTNAELRASPVPVSGPLTNAQLTAVTGAANVAAWDGAAASATVIAILKAIHAQNAQVIALLTAIETNTNTEPAGV